MIQYCVLFSSTTLPVCGTDHCLTACMTRFHTPVCVQGMLKGMGKGMLGTVTKPVSGVLDLTSGVANALRHTSRGSSHKPPPRRRLPRCCQGPGGLLPLYSASQAEAQQILYELNQQDYSEL